MKVQNSVEKVDSTHQIQALAHHSLSDPQWAQLVWTFKTKATRKINSVTWDYWTGSDGQNCDPKKLLIIITCLFQKTNFHESLLFYNELCSCSSKGPDYVTQPSERHMSVTIKWFIVSLFPLCLGMRLLKKTANYCRNQPECRTQCSCQYIKIVHW